MAILAREFYNGDTVEIARTLLGKYLVRRIGAEILVCRITETEAYVGRCDRACHAFGYRKTNRNAVMFGPPGHAYIYFVYGMHHCLNFVTEPEGEPSAVLLRGAEPIYGTDRMCKARFGLNSCSEMSPYQRKNFMNGPGKVCKALSLSVVQNAMDLTGNELFLCDSPEDIGLSRSAITVREILQCGPRIGVDYAGEDKNLPWRFLLKKGE
ncbi:MAG: DNA-3-methyladenine glycosylase [Ruminococcaceae bacterium]|nr:DNA-3-methyladenine glycosylase [Oscillospiraceae bacterium]